MKKLYKFILFIPAVCSLLNCKKGNDPIYSKVNDDRLPIIIANTNFTTPAIPSAGLAKGTAVKVELNFQQTDPIKEIQFLEEVDTSPSVLLSKVPYSPAYSKTKRCDTLIFNYTVPSAPAVGANIVVRSRVINTSGLFRDKIFLYKIK